MEEFPVLRPTENLGNPETLKGNKIVIKASKDYEYSNYLCINVNSLSFYA